MTNQEFLNLLTERKIVPGNVQDAYLEHLTFDEQTERDALWELRKGLDWNTPEYDIASKKYSAFMAYLAEKFYGDLYDPKHIETVGGEGQGEHYHEVYYFPAYDKYVRADAYYYSYSGVDYWEAWHVVVPTQVTYTEYLPAENDEQSN